MGTSSRLGKDQEPPPSAPRRLGRYELLHEIASGGMATVYLARARGHAGFERLVAVKCCHPHLRGDEEFVAMFLDEARLAARIHHPNVVATLDASDAKSPTLYLVMEFVDGYSLWQLLRGAGRKQVRIPAAIVARVVIDMLYGLQAAHDLRDHDDAPLNIVHRDVSPHNVIVGLDGTARIMDFGIAKAESRLSLTRDGRIKGKLGYMAPEQHGIGKPTVRAEVTRLADLYAAGVVMWEALTGRKLFQGENDAATVTRLVRGEVVPPTQVEPSVPSVLDAVVMRAIEREPSKRFANCLAFAEAIEECGATVATRREVEAFVRDVMAAQVSARADVMRSMSEADLVHRPDSIAPPVDAPSRSHTRTAGSIGIDAPPVSGPSHPPPPRTHISSKIAGFALALVSVVVMLFTLRQSPSRAQPLRGFTPAVQQFAQPTHPRELPVSIASPVEMPSAPAPLAIERVMPMTHSAAPRRVPRSVRPRHEYRPATL